MHGRFADDFSDDVFPTTFFRKRGLSDNGLSDDGDYLTTVYPTTDFLMTSLSDDGFFRRRELDIS